MNVTLKPLQPGCVAACKACAHRGLTKKDSEEQKHSWLIKSLHPWASVIQPPLAVPEENRWNYRDKVALSASWQDGQWCFGFLNRDNEVVPLHDCPVHHPSVRGMNKLLVKHLPGSTVFPLAFYQQSAAQVVLIVKSSSPVDLSWFTSSMEQELLALGIEGLWIHYNPCAGRHLFTKRGWQLIWGKSHSYDSEQLLYGPAAFRQLIPELAQQSVRDAVSFLAPSPASCVIDLYCGIGATLQQWCLKEADTIGVELSGEAVECARYNAPSATVLRGTCEQRLPQLTEFVQKHSRTAEKLLYVNPPRTGLETAVCAWIITTLKPARLAYLSCSAGTLKRDLESLTHAGYIVAEIRSYDFFPQTYHVEAMAFLHRPEDYNQPT